MSNPSLIKKYGNRRLYDTDESRYITLEELAAKVQGGTDVRVVDAKTGEDLTQATLTQIIIESRGAAKMLPIPLLEQLIRLGDDALTEFLGRYMSMALEMYFQVKRNATAMAAYNPFATLPFVTSDALARMFMIGPFGTSRTGPPPTWGAPMPPHEPMPGQPVAQAPETAEDGPAAAGRVDSDAAGRADSASAGRADDLAELRRELEELKRAMLQRNEEQPKRPRSRPRSRK